MLDQLELLRDAVRRGDRRRSENDLPVGTVKSRLHRARRKLQSQLTDPDVSIGRRYAPNYLEEGRLT